MERKSEKRKVKIVLLSALLMLFGFGVISMPNGAMAKKHKYSGKWRGEYNYCLVSPTGNTRCRNGNTNCIIRKNKMKCTCDVGCGLAEELPKVSRRCKFKRGKLECNRNWKGIHITWSLVGAK